MRGTRGPVDAWDGGGAPLRAVVVRETVIVGRVPLGPRPLGRPLIYLYSRSADPSRGLVMYKQPRDVSYEVDREGRFRIGGVRQGWCWINAFWREDIDPSVAEYFLASTGLSVTAGQVHEIGPLPIEGGEPVRLTCRFVGPSGRQYPPERVMVDPSVTQKIVLQYDAGPFPEEHVFLQIVDLVLDRPVVFWGLFSGNWQAKVLLSGSSRVIRPEFVDARSGNFPAVSFHVPDDLEVDLPIPVIEKIPVDLIARNAEPATRYDVYCRPISNASGDSPEKCWEGMLRPSGEGEASGRLLISPDEYEILVIPDQDSGGRRCAFERVAIRRGTPADAPMRLELTLIDGDDVEVRGPPGDWYGLTLRPFEWVIGAESIYWAFFDAQGTAIVHGVPHGEDLVLSRLLFDAGSTPLVGGRRADLAIEILGRVHDGDAPVRDPAAQSSSAADGRDGR